MQFAVISKRATSPSCALPTQRHIPSLAPTSRCNISRCRAFSSTASLSTWQATNRFSTTQTRRGMRLQEVVTGRIVTSVSNAIFPITAASAQIYTICAGSCHRQVTRMGNKSTTGPFVPVVKLVRAVVGPSKFNQLRGKGISLHSQGNFILCAKQ